MTDKPHLRRMALSLLGSGPDPRIAELSAEQWARLDVMLAEHRLQPLLHAQWSGGCRDEARVPRNIAKGWATAHRLAGMAALRQRASLLRVYHLLCEAGIHAVALKGPWLAWHAYPSPALRPMRDLDLLVGPDELRQSWCLLRCAGFAAPLGEPDWTNLQRGKHLPPLLSPDGIVVELHSRVWEDRAEAGHAMPTRTDASFAARARPGSSSDPVLYPSGEDMLAHLIIHAVYSHWLDAGPLVLADIDFLLRQHQPDWPAFWIQAQTQGWARGAGLIFAIIERWRKPGFLQATACPIEVPHDLLDGVPELLLQPMSRRAEARILARLRRDGIATVLRDKWAEACDNPAYFARHLLRRGGQLTAGMGSRAAREKGREMKQLGDWLLVD